MNDLTLLNPSALWALLAVPVIVVLHGWRILRRREAQVKFSDPRLFAAVNPRLVVDTPSEMARAGLVGLASLLLVLAMARPGGDPQLVEEIIAREGVDLSSSMRATDVAPNRLEATRAGLRAFIDQIEQDRLGMTVFAGSVSLQTPLTLDHQAVRMMTDIISTSFLPVDGTAFGDALKFALDKIPESRRRGAVIVLLTDGENTRGTPPKRVVPELKKAGVRVYTIGLGTAAGARIPDGTDAAGNPKYKMYQGQPVITRLDAELLKHIASETGGAYFPAETHQALLRAYQEIGRLSKTTHREVEQQYRYTEYFPWFLFPALVLLLAETLWGGLWRITEIMTQEQRHG